MKDKRYLDAVNRDVLKLTKTEREFFANKYSEGCIQLEKLLNDLWDLGVETKGCCRGHDDNLSYISMVIDDNSIDIINNLINKFLTDDKFSLNTIVALSYNCNFGMIFSLSFEKNDINKFLFLDENLKRSNDFNCYLDDFIKIKEKYDDDNYFCNLILKDYSAILHIEDQFDKIEEIYACYLSELLEDADYNIDLYDNIKNIFCYCDDNSLKKLIVLLDMNKKKIK